MLIVVVGASGKSVVQPVGVLVGGGVRGSAAVEVIGVVLVVVVVVVVGENEDDYYTGPFPNGT